MWFCPIGLSKKSSRQNAGTVNISFFSILSCFLCLSVPQGTSQKCFQASVHSSKIPSRIMTNTKLSSRFTVALYNPLNWRILVTVLPGGQNNQTILSSKILIDHILNPKALWSKSSQQQITVSHLRLLFMAVSTLYHSVSHCTQEAATVLLRFPAIRTAALQRTQNLQQPYLSLVQQLTALVLCSKRGQIFCLLSKSNVVPRPFLGHFLPCPKAIYHIMH